MSFWQGKRVVVTGGAGMIGTALCRLLVEAGAFVRVLDDFSRGNGRVPGVAYRMGDAGDEYVCRQVFAEADAVFNLAAFVAGVLFNQSHNAGMFERNIRLVTAPVLAAGEIGVTNFLQVSSVCVYSPRYNHPCREEFGHADEPHDSNGGYAWAKRMGERLVLWAKRPVGASLPHGVIVRPSNVFGPGDYFDERSHVIPALIRKCLEDDVIRVHGTGEERREFLYVDDAARGMMAALQHGRSGEAYNIGTNGDTCVPIRTLVGLIRLATGAEHKPVEYSGGNAGDPARWSDCSKAWGDLDWRYAVGLEEGIQRTVAWYTSGVQK